MTAPVRVVKTLTGGQGGDRGQPIGNEIDHQHLDDREWRAEAGDDCDGEDEDLACLGGWLSLRGGTRWQHALRAVWTLGCVLFDVHVACAFHFYHQWSHAVAWQHTAERTRELLGVAMGDGIYFSYLFLVLWAVDVVWLWLTPLSHRGVADEAPAGGSPAAPASADAIAVPLRTDVKKGTPGWRVAVHVFLLFIAINGAIVFEGGVSRWAGIVACIVLAGVVVWRTWERRSACPKA